MKITNTKIYKYFKYLNSVNYNSESERVKQLDKLIPDYLKAGEHKHLLYVGGHLRFGRNMQTCDYWQKCGYTIDVIEIFPDNVKQLQSLKWINRLIEGDIRAFRPYGIYDLVVWWHGPEHVKKGEVTKILKDMQAYAEAVIFATPNGEYDQGEEYGNIHEQHEAAWYIEDFERLGMIASAVGEPDEKNGNIIAYWDKYL